MMQITRKSSPLRGLTVLLALMLGAGLVLSGCGDDDSTTTTPAPAPAPPAPPAQPDPVSVPGGLTVSATGEDFIEFSWEAVEGASGYDIQMSMTEGDFSSSMMATVTATMHRFTVSPSTTAYARVRANMDGRESDWSGAVMGMSMAASLTLGTPMPEVSSTGPDHIEWTWDAVADAAAYQVRVAASADGLDMATAEITTATSYRVTAAAETTMYISVRAAAGTPTSPVVGDWSDAVAGTSDVAPLPFVVSMTPPEAGADKDCSGQAFCPDDGTDPEKARASVNTKMMVVSSHTAQVSPVFLEDAGAVALSDGENTPFANVNWSALQSVVANEGVTFMFQRVAAAAGQEPAAMGDAMYITCGPFRCSEAMDEAPSAPEISISDSAACNEFELDLKLDIGLGYNGRNADDTADAAGALYDRNVGIDAGWVYTSSATATVVHEFEGVPGPTGGNLKVKGADISKTSRPTALVMARGTGDKKKAVNYFGGASQGTELTSTEAGPVWNGMDGGDCLGTNIATSNTTSSYGYNNIGGTAGERRTLQRPQECFRIITGGRDTPGAATTIRRNYLPGYKIHVSPNASVTWAGSAVAWEKGTDPFDGYDCEPHTISAAEEVDDQLGSLCESYQEQVRGWWGNGLAKSNGSFTFEYVVTSAYAADGTRTVDAPTFPVDSRTAATEVGAGKKFVRINVVAKSPTWNEDFATTAAGDETEVHKAKDSRWTSLWLVDSTAVDAGDTPRSRDGTAPDADMYRVLTGDGSLRGAYVGAYPTSGDDDRSIRSHSGTIVAPRAVFTVDLLDDDGDPMYGDFGKVDFQHLARSTNEERGKADNYPSTNPDAYACSDDDGTRCDSEQEFEGTITFTLYPDTNDCTEEIDVAFTCTWDADGDEDRTGDASGATAGTFGMTNIGNFVKCEAS